MIIFFRAFLLLLIIFGFSLGFILLFEVIQFPWEGRIQKASVWAGAVLGLTGLPFGAFLCLLKMTAVKSAKSFSQGNLNVDSTETMGRALVGVSLYFVLEAMAGEDRGGRMAFLHKNSYLAYPLLTLMTVLTFYFAFKYSFGLMYFKYFNKAKK